jgi:hypothetical protein
MKQSDRTTYDLSPGSTVSYALTQFTWEEFEKFWPGIEEMLDLVPHTWKHWTKDYIRMSVERGHIQVWGIGPPPKAVLIFFTQIGVHPVDRVLHVTWGAGNFDKEMLPTLEAALVNYAQLCDCELIEVRGRPGWDPHFKSIGMKREYVTWSYPVPKARMQ